MDSDGVDTEFWVVPGYHGVLIGPDGTPSIKWAVHEGPDGHPYIDVSALDDPR